jgi:predicted glycosyltransferase
MASNFFDIVIVTDPRFQGGTGSAVAAEISAAERAGYRIGLIAYEAINLRQPLPYNPRLLHLVESGKITQVVPGTQVSCTLALLHNPFAAGLLPVEPLGLSAETRVVVVHHPPIDGNGAPAYDLVLTRRNAEEILNGPAIWAPVGPNARAAFRGLAYAPDLMPTDWTNVIDVDAWHHVPERHRGRGIVIGRHSRADLRKFPASRQDFIEIYGDSPDVAIDMLGCPDELIAMLAPIRQNWRLRKFGEIPVSDYLDGLDVFVYYHREDWVEAFGYSVIEAMARGVPCVLSPTLAPSFADAARITPPGQALETAQALASDPRDAREAGYELVRQRHSYRTVVDRLNRLIGPPTKRPAPSKSQHRRPEPAALLISTNGIGMGHLARTIAIARRLHAPVRPVLVTMSHAASIADDFGLPVEFIPYHSYLQADKNIWNVALCSELQALIDAYGARVLVFDGNSPFQGILDALETRPQVWSIWSRRGMWRPNSGQEFMDRERFFDAVVEPRDLAEAFDTGPTAASTAITRKVAPIRLLDRQEILPKSVARGELGLRPDTMALLVQLGGGNNFDMRLVRDLVLRHLGGRDTVEIVLADWKIAMTPHPPDLPENVKSFSIFPIARYLNAFDATVSAVGYNSFHEATDAALPAIYIPNENPSQDDQLARAQFAARRGFAFVARHDQPEALLASLDAILDPDRRARMRAAAERVSTPNGALDAARLIAHLALTNRGHREG